MAKVCNNCNNENNDDASYCSNCGYSLAKPQVIEKTIPLPVARVIPSGMCFYHPNLRATYVCNLCGRSICRHDSRLYGGMVICSICHLGLYSVPVFLIDYPVPLLVHTLPMI